MENESDNAHVFESLNDYKLCEQTPRLRSRSRSSSLASGSSKFSRALSHPVWNSNSGHQQTISENTAVLNAISGSLPKRLFTKRTSIDEVSNAGTSISVDIGWEHRPVLVVGDGLSAADVVLHCLEKGQPVVQSFRRDRKDIKGRYHSSGIV